MQEQEKDGLEVGTPDERKKMTREMKKIYGNAQIAECARHLGKICGNAKVTECARHLGAIAPRRRAPTGRVGGEA